MVLRDANFDVIGMAGFHDAEYIVGDARRTNVHAMEMEIGRVELVR